MIETTNKAGFQPGTMAKVKTSSGWVPARFVREVSYLPGRWETNGRTRVHWIFRNLSTGREVEIKSREKIAVTSPRNDSVAQRRLTTPSQEKPMSTNPKTITQLAAQVQPAADFTKQTPTSGVSVSSLLASGVNTEWMELQLGLGKKITELPALWAELQAKIKASTPPAAPAVAPHLTKEQSDATKKTIQTAPVSTTPKNFASIEEELAYYRAENERLKKSAPVRRSEIGFKVSEKGAVSVYGVGRFPVTLYAEQWERVLAKSADLVAFMKANHSKLSFKDAE